MDRPHAGAHYPRSVGELQAWFRTDTDCLDYLEWLRWPAGFACPECGHVGGWRLGDGRYRCSRCRGCTSVTAGTIFDRTRTPLTVWFTACWLFAASKDGISALSLQRTLEIGSYQTAWAMLHRLRSVLVRPGRDRLAGVVEVDETYIGGEEPGVAGRARGKKVLTGIAVEVRAPNGFGRCRMRPLANASAESLHAFVTDYVEPRAWVAHSQTTDPPRSGQVVLEQGLGDRQHARNVLEALLRRVVSRQRGAAIDLDTQQVTDRGRVLGPAQPVYGDTAWLRPRRRRIQRRFQLTRRRVVHRACRSWSSGRGHFARAELARHLLKDVGMVRNTLQLERVAPEPGDGDRGVVRRRGDMDAGTQSDE